MCRRHSGGYTTRVRRNFSDLLAGDLVDEEGDERISATVAVPPTIDTPGPPPPSTAELRTIFSFATRVAAAAAAISGDSSTVGGCCGGGGGTSPSDKNCILFGVVGHIAHKRDSRANFVKPFRRVRQPTDYDLQLSTCSSPLLQLIAKKQAKSRQRCGLA